MLDRDTFTHVQTNAASNRNDNARDSFRFVVLVYGQAFMLMISLKFLGFYRRQRHDVDRTLKWWLYKNNDVNSLLMLLMFNSFLTSLCLNTSCKK